MLTRRLLHLLCLLALLWAPLSMAGAHLPPAGQGSGASGHCAEMEMGPGEHDRQNEQSGASTSVDCLIACSLLPAANQSISGRFAYTAGAPLGAVPPLAPGLHPSAEPEPPRAG
jgi:hypothetical protein